MATGHSLQVCAYHEAWGAEDFGGLGLGWDGGMGFYMFTGLQGRRPSHGRPWGNDGITERQ